MFHIKKNLNIYNFHNGSNWSRYVKMQVKIMIKNWKYRDKPTSVTGHGGPWGYETWGSRIFLEIGQHMAVMLSALR
jgi:hypothetical protein